MTGICLGFFRGCERKLGVLGLTMGFAAAVPGDRAGQPLFTDMWFGERTRMEC